MIEQTQIQTFNFVGDYQKRITDKETKLVRYVHVHVDVNVRCFLDDNNDVWFVGKDVCDVLDICDVSKTFSNIKYEFKGIEKIFTIDRGLQSMLVCNEDGLIDIISSSNKRIAEDFKTWCRGIIKNEIRKKIFNQPIKKDDEYYVKKIEKIENETKKLQFDLQNEAMKIFEDKGEERYVMICMDNIKNIVSSTTSNKPMIEDKSKLYSITERIQLHMKSRLTKQQNNNMTKWGKHIESEYIIRNKKQPQKCLKYVNGHNCEVACYTVADYEKWIDREINFVLNS